MEAINKLLFWQRLPRLIFETEIFLSQKVDSIKMVTDASDFASGGHTLDGPLITARYYFTCEESVESSPFWDLLGAIRYLQAFVHICIVKFVVVQVDVSEALQFSTDALLVARGERAQAHALAILVGIVISMRLAWGPVC